MTNSKKFFSINNKIFQLAAKIIAVCAAVLQVAALVVLCLGVNTFFGKNMSVVNSVNVTLGILNMSKFYYRGIFGTVLGIFYFVLLINLIRRMIQTIAPLKKIFAKSAAPSFIENCSYTIVKRSVADVIGIAMYVALAQAIKPFELGLGAKLIFGVAVFLFIVQHAFSWLINNEHYINVLIHVGHVVVSTVAILFCTNLLGKGVANKLISVFANIEAMPADYWSTMLCTIISSIVTIIALFAVYRAMDSFAANEKQLMNKAASAARTVMVCAIILFACSLALFIIADSTVDVDMIIATLKPHLSLILASIAMFISLNTPEASLKVKIAKKKNNNNEDKEEEAAPKKETKPTVLVINERVYEIADGEYKDRLDISEVIIHEDVIRVGSKVFKGCGALTAIHCAAAGKPSKWADDWNDGCFATVHWGSTGKKEEAPAEEAPAEEAPAEERAEAVPSDI